jgi:hypothetical protein
MPNGSWAVGITDEGLAKSDQGRRGDSSAILPLNMKAFAEEADFPYQPAINEVTLAGAVRVAFAALRQGFPGMGGF